MYMFIVDLENIHNDYTSRCERKDTGKGNDHGQGNDYGQGNDTKRKI